MKLPLKHSHVVTVTLHPAATFSRRHCVTLLSLLLHFSRRHCHTPAAPSPLRCIVLPSYGTLPLLHTHDSILPLLCPHVVGISPPLLRLPPANWSSHWKHNVTFSYYFFRGHAVTLRQYILTILLLRYACRQSIALLRKHAGTHTPPRSPVDCVTLPLLRPLPSKLSFHCSNLPSELSLPPPPALIRCYALPSLLFHIHCYDHCRQNEAPPATFSCRNSHAPTATFSRHHCSLPPLRPAETITPLLQYLNVVTVTLYWAATFSLRHCHTPTATCARRHSYTCLSFLRYCFATIAMTTSGKVKLPLQAQYHSRTLSLPADS